MIGVDREGGKHFIREGSATKACGYRVSLCGKESLPTEEPDDTPVCIRCQHGLELGLHQIDRARLRRAKKPTGPQ
jgi:hypothetical protein